MSRILILGGGALQVPLIQAAKRRGLETWVVDGSSKCPGRHLADHFRQISTVDTEAVVQLVEENNIDGVTTGATDKPMRVVGACVDRLNKPGPSLESTLAATDKVLMAQVFSTANVEQPDYWVGTCMNEFADALQILKESTPLIVKPADSSGSRGVTLVTSLDAFESALSYAANASSSGTAIVQELLIGHEVSVEMLIDAEGIPHVVTITDKVTTGAPHFVELGHLQPSALPDSDLMRISDLATRASNSLGLKSCAGHCEIMMTPQGPKIIEFGARFGGDFIGTDLVCLSTGVDIANEVLSLALGLPINYVPTMQRGASVQFSSLGTGTVKSIDGLTEARNTKGVETVGTFVEVGERTSGTSNSSQRGVYVIADGESAQEAYDSARKALLKIRISYV